MGRKTYNGGGTIVHPGSGFFSHKGGPGRKRKPVDGSDRPGPAKPGSICDFRPLRPKQKVVEFPKKAKAPEPIPEEAQEAEIQRLKAKSAKLINRTEKLVKAKKAEIRALRKKLADAETEYESINVALTFAAALDFSGEQIKDSARLLDKLLHPLFAASPKVKDRTSTKSSYRKRMKPGRRRP